MSGIRILCLPALCIALASCATRGRSERRPPNILLIVSDDQGYRDLGCAGSPDIKTPRLDRLAKEGVRLTNFYVSWPACTPSRGSFLTGRYPQRNGTYDMYRNEAPDYGHKYAPEEYRITFERIAGMDSREVLLPRVLKGSGYVSGIFGKWDLGVHRRFLPLQRGFDDFYGFANTGIDYWTHERYGVPSMFRNNAPTLEDRGTYSTLLFEREAARFIRANRNRPWFCYVPHNAPHGASNLDKADPSIHVPEEFRKRYPAPNAGNRRDIRRRDFMAAVTCMDESIGRLLDLVSELGQADNTIVIFFSDNGGGGGADNVPLRGRKGRLFEGGIRVPCIVRWPGRLPAGRVCDEFLTSMEILPMLIHAVGAFPPRNVVLDGFDMAPVLAGERPSPRTEMFWQRRGDKAARVGNLKWVDSADGKGLFDLSKDMGEEHDLSGERPDLLQKVQARFAAWKEEMSRAEPRGPFRDY